MMLRPILLSIALVAAALTCRPPEAAAEANEVRIARQFGISYLPLMMMVENKLIEKHAANAGIRDVKVSLVQLAASNAMNEALLSGNIDFASGGTTGLITLWDKTRNSLDVRGVAALTSMPLYLVTRNPAVKSVRDLSEKDRIALPAIKVSPHAVLLQMAAADAFGPSQFSRFDPLTVSLPHGDAMANVLSGVTEINAHFSAPPYQYQELERPGIHRILNSYDVLGGRSTFALVWTSGRFRDANPKLYDAFVAALDEAMAVINRDRDGAAEFYLRVSKEKIAPELLKRIMNDPETEFTTVPTGIMKYVDFMARIGTVKTKPGSWRDLFFPNVYHLAGS